MKPSSFRINESCANLCRHYCDKGDECELHNFKIDEPDSSICNDYYGYIDELNELVNKGLNLLLMEDDCAPDRREYFDKGMLEITGMTYSQFIDHPSTITMHVEDDMHAEWRNGYFVLSFDGDDPFYKLHRIIVEE